MDRDCNPDALESLARGDDLADRAAVHSHVALCERCARELAWLRAERRLFRDRAWPSVDPLWDGVADRLAPPRPATVGPYRTAAPVPPVAPRRPWAAFAAGAVAATVAIAGVAALTLRVNVTPAPTVAGVRRATPPRTQRLAHASRVVEVPVSSPVAVHLETWAADVQATPGRDGYVRVTVRDAEAVPTVTRRPDGRYDVLFNGGRLGRGAVDIELPRASSVDLTTASGDVTVRGIGGSARLTTVSGQVWASDLRGAEVTTSSGDVELPSVDGSVRVRTVSGNVRLAHSRAASEVTVESSSGDLDWAGLCAHGCRLDARSISGDVRLVFAPQSGFSVRFSTVSGEINDTLGTGAALSDRGGPLPGRYGDGAGSVEAATTSGSLALARGPAPDAR